MATNHYRLSQESSRSLDGKKLYLGVDVLTATRERLRWVFETFERICLSFSGGKDSTVLLHLAAAEARKQKRKFSVLFIDWEVQYSATINHIEAMRQCYADCTDHFYWICLPLTTVSGVSQFQTEWTAWQDGVDWVRKPPDCAITSPSFFPFYYNGMTFESFVPAFNQWFSQGCNTGILVGIRTDESLNRFQSINSKRKRRYEMDKPWTTALAAGSGYGIYPLYDWRVRDVWRFYAHSGLPYNPVYDLMFRAGVSLTAMRICEPFGPEQRKGLWLYHVLDPQTWGKVCQRVSGANSGARYVRQGKNYFGSHQITKPAHHSWQSYAHFLLDSMPMKTAEHYRSKIAVYLRWFQQHDYPDGIPDEQDNDTGSRDIPSWRRICKVMMRYDYWCRGLSFSPTKTQHYQRYIERLKKKREEWRLI